MEEDTLNQIRQLLTADGFELVSTKFSTAIDFFEAMYRKGDVTVTLKRWKELTPEEKAELDKIEFVVGKGDILHIFQR